MNALPKGYEAAARAWDNAAPEDNEVPEHIVWAAHEEIARNLVEASEVDELVSVVAGSLDLMAWLAGQKIPHYLLGDFRELDRKVRSFARSVDEIVEREMAS